MGVKVHSSMDKSNATICVLLFEKAPAEVVWAYGEDAFRPPPVRGLPARASWENTQG